MPAKEKKICHQLRNRPGHKFTFGEMRDGTSDKTEQDAVCVNVMCHVYRRLQMTVKQRTSWLCC